MTGTYEFYRPLLPGKPYFLFPDVMKKWSSQKNCTGIWSFLYNWERWYFSKKNTWWYDIFFKCSEKMVFKKIPPKYDRSCIIWKDGIFLPRKHSIFSLDGKWKIIFLKKYMEIWYFLYIRINVINMTLYPLLPKKIKDDLLPQKYT